MKHDARKISMMMMPVVRLRQRILVTSGHRTPSTWAFLKASVVSIKQTFVDTYSKVAFAKLYTTKTPITAADMLNDKVLPYFEQQGLPMLRILTDRGTEYCGRADQHDYQLYLALNDIDHTKTKVRSPQTNGICERFHKTILHEFFQIILRKNIYTDLESLQADLNEWLVYYNTERTHQGKMCCGRTPLKTLQDGKKIPDYPQSSAISPVDSILNEWCVKRG